MIPFDEHNFQMGWQHQLVKILFHRDSEDLKIAAWSIDMKHLAVWIFEAELAQHEQCI